MVVGGAGDGDAARLGQRLHAVGDVDAVAVDVVALDDDVAEIDADAEIEPLLGRHGGVALRLLLLHLDGAAHGVDDAGELDQQAVAHGLDQPPVMGGDLRLEDLLQVGLEAGARALLVDLAQAAIADDIGDQDGGEPTLHAWHQQSPTQVVSQVVV